MQKIEGKEGIAGGLSHRIRKRLQPSLACGLRRVFAEGRGKSVGRVWIGRKEVALGTVEGLPERDRAALKIPKAKGIKSTSQRNQSQLELSWFSRWRTQGKLSGHFSYINTNAHTSTQSP